MTDMARTVRWRDHQIITEPEHLLALLPCLPRDQECIWVLPLDARHRPLRRPILVHRGGMTHCDCDPRCVFRRLLAVGAVAWICVHNHPSGDPAPSDQDLALLCRLRSCSDLLGLPLIDFLIVARSRRFWIASRKGHVNAPPKTLTAAAESR